jgi:hypothetical protein
MNMASYDGTLQMFVQTPQEVNMRRLSFLRWLAEHGKLEHAAAGPSSGPFVKSVTVSQPAAYSVAV